jgi:hypothetical protein
MNKKDHIDLLYFTNQNFIDKYNQKIDTSVHTVALKEDILFYRKRILQTTKELLRDNSINSNVDNSFYQYAQELIKYYKFIDKKDIIQEEYKNLKEKPKKEVNTNFKLSENNKIMSRETKKHIKTIKDCIPIVVRTKKKKKRTYPKKKEIDIKDPRFRIKGLEKEKSKQFICPEKQKKEKEEGLQKNKQKNKKTNKKEKGGKLENKKEVDLVAAILGK